MLFSLPSWDYFWSKSLLLECAVLIMTQKLLWLLLWGMISFCSNAQRNVLPPNCCSSQLICLFPSVRWNEAFLLSFLFIWAACSRHREGLGWCEGPAALLSSGISLAPLPQHWDTGCPLHGEKGWGLFCPCYLGHCPDVSLCLGLEAPSALGPSWEWKGSILEFGSCLS